ncbi:MAG: hypothetical protein JWN86_1408 [Planctomycetota bacterium]|nr:hypothetical protein [Planctomycetota bacterium]
MYISEQDCNPETKIPSERQVLTWLRKRIHPYCWGQSDRRKEGFSRTTRCQVVRFFERLRSGRPGGSLPRMKNSLIMTHFAGWRILYFQADGRYDTPEVIVCIDIDCHGKGRYEGAVACVMWLIDNGFPGLFWSKSTNGRGIHAYIRVDKAGTNARGLDTALCEFERWLKHQASVQRWDIEGIEVKGRPPVFDWGLDKYELLGLKMGSLAKLPVEALDRPLDLMGTTLKPVDELCRLGESVPGDRVRERGEDNCTTYSLPLRDGAFDEITPDDFTPFVPDPRNREWPLWVERMARVGLVEDDTMAEVVFELGKWLLWVELYGDHDREARTVELLQRYVLDKHNGCVTRLNDGKEAEVFSQVERIIRGACDMPSGSKELFLRIRQKRQQGRYRRRIEIVPILEGVEGELAAGGPGKGEYECTTYSLPFSEIALPPSIEDNLVRYARTHKMRRTKGEYPIARFARQVLGILWHNRGAARIHTDDLTAMVGNVHQQNDYKQALRGLGLVEDWTGTYRVGAASALYRLTHEAKHAFEEAYSQETTSAAV